MPGGDVPGPLRSYGSCMLLSNRPKSSAIDVMLREVPLFAACTAAEIRTIRRLGDVVLAGPGTVLAGDAERHARFHAVLAGEIAVHRFGRDERPLSAGDTFGALETLRRLRMPATLVAATASQVLVVGPREFAGLVDEIPGVARRLLLAHVPQHSLTLVGGRPATGSAVTRPA